MSTTQSPNVVPGDGVTSPPADAPLMSATKNLKHARTRSLGTDLGVSLSKVIAVLSSMEKTMVSEAGVDISQFKELVDVKTSIKELREGLSILAKRREAEPTKVIKSVSFSAVDHNIIKDLGVEKIITVDQDGFVTMLTAFYMTKKALEQGIKTALDVLKVQLGKVEACLRIVNEAGSRIIIDQVLLELVHLCKIAGGQFVAWVELTIANKENPVTIEFDNILTTLTGIVDYAFGKVKRAWEKQYKDTESDKVQTVATIAKGAGFRDTFTLLEAKRVGTNLELCLPQAIAQAIAMTTHTVHLLEGGKPAAPSSDVAFCLSNGWQWMFTVIHKHKSGVVECRHLPILTIKKQSYEGMDLVLKPCCTGQLYKVARSG